LKDRTVFLGAETKHQPLLKHRKQKKYLLVIYDYAW